MPRARARAQGTPLPGPCQAALAALAASPVARRTGSQHASTPAPSPAAPADVPVRPHPAQQQPGLPAHAAVLCVRQPQADCARCLPPARRIRWPLRAAPPALHSCAPLRRRARADQPAARGQALLRADRGRGGGHVVGAGARRLLRPRAPRPAGAPPAGAAEVPRCRRRCRLARRSTAQSVGSTLERHYGASSLTLAIQVGGWVGWGGLLQQVCWAVPPDRHPAATAGPRRCLRQHGAARGPQRAAAAAAAPQPSPGHMSHITRRQCWREGPWLRLRLVHDVINQGPPCGRLTHTCCRCSGSAGRAGCGADGAARARALPAPQAWGPGAQRRCVRSDRR